MRLPADWKFEKLSHIATLQTGIALGARKNIGNMVKLPYLRVANVQAGHFDLGEIKVLPIAQAQKDRYLCMRPMSCIWF